MLDRQTIFNQSLAAIEAQGTASMDSEGKCLHRGPNGTRCAIGHLIPDDKYDEVLEGYRAWHEPVAALFGLGAGAEDAEDRNFLRRIQSCHDLASAGLRDGDNTVFLSVFLKRMDDVANAYNLQVPA